MATNSKVDFYFNKPGKWQMELEQLRAIVLSCGLDEELKWGCPCYRFQEGNIVLIHEFKEYCALLFFKGALLNDTDGMLIQQTENVQAARQIRFTNVEEIIARQSNIKVHIFEAIEVEKAGLKVELKKTSEFEVADEFKEALAKNPSVRIAFEALTPGRQRAYLMYFATPKQSKTRSTRVEKCIAQILMGKGLND